MGKSKKLVWSCRRAAFIALAVLALFAPLGATAARAADPADPFGGRKEIFVKDSILALTFSYTGHSAKPAVISFDLTSPDVAIATYDAAHVNKRDTLAVSNTSTKDGIPAALGSFRDAKGNLPFYVADYGASGAYVRRGYIDLSGNISDYRAFNSAMSGETKWFATDMALADIDHDGAEDVIIGEIHRDGNDVDRLRIRILSGADGSVKATHDILTGNEGRETQLRFDVIPPVGMSAPTLGVTYSRHSRDLGHYYFRVFGLASSGASFGLTEHKIGNDTTDEIGECDRSADAHDVAAGDYDGDGIMEFMVIADEDGDSRQMMKRYYPQLGNPSQWQTQPRLDIRYTTAPSSGYDRAVARAADLDNCGRDEFIWVMTDSSNMFLLGAAGVGSNNELKTMFFHKERDNHSTDLMDSSLRMVLDMTAGSFAGRWRIGESNKASGEVVILRRSDNGQRHNWLYVLSPTIGDDGRMDGLEAIESRYANNIGDEYDTSTPVLLAGNILGESLRVGDGELVSQEDMIQVTSVIDMPPMHADYIALPWEQSGARKALDATNYENFNAAITTGTESEVSHSVSTKTDAAFTAGFHVNVDTRLQLDLAAKAGQQWVNENTETIESSGETSDQTTTTTDDIVLYTVSTQYHWTYPIVGARVKSGDEYVPLFYEVVTASDPRPTYTSGSKFLFYRPSHEIFNAMSYPSDFYQLPDYDPARAVIGKPGTAYSTDTNIASLLKWTSTTGETATNSEAITAEASVALGVALGTDKGFPTRAANRDDAKAVVEGTADGHYFFETASALSNRFTESTSLQVTKDTPVAQGGDIASNVSYMIASHAYSYPNGALHFTHTSGLANVSGQRTSMLWGNSASTYVSNPDAALLLPGKLLMNKADNDAFMYSVPQTAPVEALRMNNIRITNKAGREYNMFSYGQVPVEGGVSTFHFPVYNYSTGKELQNLTVRVSIAERDYADQFRFPEETKIVLTRDIAIPRIPHKDQEVNNVAQGNWIEVSADFDTSRLTPGNYALFVELDPEDQIAETHERWDYRVRSGDAAANQFADNENGDFGGNNLGYFNFAVIVGYPDDVENAPAGTRAAAIPDGSVTLKLEMEEVPDLSLGRLRQAIANREDIPIRMSLYYDEGPDFVPGFVAQAIYTPDPSGNPEYRYGIAMKAIPGLHRGERYTFDSTLGRAFLLAYGERSGKIDIELLGAGAAFVKDGVERTFPFASQDDGGSGCGTGAFTLAALAVLAGAAVKRRLRGRPLFRRPFMM